MLLEATSFREDQDTVAAMMTVLDAWRLQGSPQPGDYYHLLMQHAELLADSAGRVAALQKLADKVAAVQQQVTELAWTRDERDQLRRQVDDLRDDVAKVSADIAKLGTDLAGALTRREDHVLLDPPVIAVEPDVEPDWDGDTRFHAGEPVILGEAMQDWASQAGWLLCTACDQWKPPEAYFKNSKSPTGRETRCKTCRRAGAKAA